MVRRTTKSMHRAYHNQLARRAIRGGAANFDDAEFFVSENPVRLRAPLVLISQVQRSGGTLLSQLFDAHPQLAAYPHELKQPFSTPDHWPPLDPEKGMHHNFQLLFDLNFPRLVRRGFVKGDRNPVRHPFLLISRIEYRVFQKLWEEEPPSTPRDIADHFFTAFFNGWLNYQGRLGEKRWMTAFAPRLAHPAESAAGFFDCYPDGRLIQIIRSPASWFASAKNHSKSGFEGKSVEHILSRWRVSAESMVRNRNEFGDKVILLRFEDLVGNTEPTMRALADMLSIDFDPVLLEPTFNGHEMRANSSFAVDQTGLIDAPLKREKTLSEDERRLIAEQCDAVYAGALESTLSVTPSSKRRRAHG
jgi:hypothetical protein